MKKSLLILPSQNYLFNTVSALTIILFLVTATIINGQINETEATGIRTIYLIRHGDYNIEDKRDPDVGKELIPLGIAQAKLVASRLKSLPLRITSLTSSTMTRAKQTAMIINNEFPELEFQQSTLIRECTPPTWREDITAEESKSDLEDCVENLEAAFTKFFIPSTDYEDKNDVIVCHGNVIRYFITKVLKVDTKAWLQMTISNCSITIVRVMPDGTMKLISFNDIGHIPPNLQTETGGNNEIKKLRVN